MYSTRVCSLVNLRGGWGGGVGGWVGGGRWGGGGWGVGGWGVGGVGGGGVTDTFKQRENQNKEKLTKVAAYEL